MSAVYTDRLVYPKEGVYTEPNMFGLFMLHTLLNSQLFALANGVSQGSHNNEPSHPVGFPQQMTWPMMASFRNSSSSSEAAAAEAEVFVLAQSDGCHPWWVTTNQRD